MATCPANKTQELDDSKWHEAKVEVKGARMKMYLDGQLKINDDSSARIEVGNLFGWAARTGGANNEHRIRKLRVKVLNSTPPAVHRYELRAARWRDGKYENALRFDGKDDYVEIPADPSLNDIVGEVTVAAWIKLDAGGKDQRIFGTQDGSAGGFRLGVHTGDKVEFEIRDSSNNYYLNRDAANGTVLTPDVWYHVVGVYDNANDRLATYVNGSLDNEISTTGDLAATTGISVIGREPFSDGYYWDGKIDEVAVFNRALTDNEIKSLWATGTAYYPFENLTGTTAYDNFGNNDGTINGATRENAGYYGRSLSFNGSDYVEVPDDPTLSIADEITVAAWVRLSEGSQTMIRKDPSDWLFGWGDGETSNPGNNPQWYVENTGGTGTLIIGPPVPYDEWHHVAGTYDGSVMKLYVDGNLENSTSYSGPLNTSNSYLRIGAWSSENFYGMIDEVQIYDRALTPDQIGQIAHDELAHIDNNIWRSGPHDSDEEVVWENLDVSATIPTDTYASITLEVSANEFSSVSDNITINLTDGTNTYDISALQSARYIRINGLNLSTENTRRTPVIDNVTIWCRYFKYYIDLYHDSENIGYDQKYVENIELTLNFKSDNNADYIWQVYNHDPPVPADGLVGYWKMDDPTDNNVKDETDYRNDGYAYGPIYVPGKFDYALDFDGVDDYVEVPMTDELSQEGSDTISVSAWINIREPRYGIINGRPYWILHWTEGGGTLPTKMRFYVGAGGSWSSVTSSTAVSSGWHHWAGVYDGANLKIYLDGELDGTAEVSGTISSTGDGDSNWITFGKDYHPSYSAGRYNAGLIDRVLIYDRALTPDEISELATTGWENLRLGNVGAEENWENALIVDPENYIGPNDNIRVRLIGENFTDSFRSQEDYLVYRINYEIIPQAGALIESSVYDAGMIVNWKEISWNADELDLVEVETRTGGTENAYDGSWSNWEAQSRGRSITSPDNRYIQYRVKLFNQDSRSPKFISIKITYTPPPLEGAWGNIEAEARNRYYPDQTYTYEAGAVIMKQDGKYLMQREPELIMVGESESGEFIWELAADWLAGEFEKTEVSDNAFRLVSGNQEGIHSTEWRDMGRLAGWENLKVDNLGSLENVEMAVEVAQPPVEPSSWWTFDDAHTRLGKAKDIWENNDGDIFGVIDGVAGKLNESYQFDGIDDYVEVLDANDLDLENDFTVAAWFNPDRLSNDSTIVSKDNNYKVFVNSDNKICWEWKDSSGGNHSLTGSATIENGQWYENREWYHVAIVHSLEGLRKIYLNGQLENQSIDTLNAATNDNSLYIGCSPSENYFGGMIDEVMIFHGALNEENIELLYERMVDGNRIRDRKGILEVSPNNGISDLLPFRYIRVITKFTNGTSTEIDNIEIEAMKLVIVDVSYSIINGDRSWKVSSGTESIRFVPTRIKIEHIERAENVVVDLENKFLDRHENVWRGYLEEREENFTEEGYDVILDPDLLRLTIKGIQASKKDIYYRATVKEVEAWIT